jgi:hypothetical protein
MYSKLTDKVCYKGLSCLGMPHKTNAIVSNKMEEEIVYNKDYRGGDKGNY